MINKININKAVTNTEPRHKDRVYANLKRDIIRCKLRPGTAVSEAKLAALYNVGKAPIRDALARLCHEHLVVSQPRKGHTITPITIRDVIDIFEVRMCLEPLGARMAAGNVDEDVIRRAASACEVPITSDDSSGIDNFLSSNSEFHCLIARYSGNQRLAKQITHLLEDTERVRYINAGFVTARAESISEHSELVEALIAGNGDEAAILSKRHIQRGWRMVMGSLLSKFKFMDQNLGSSGEDALADNLLQQDYPTDAARNESSENIFKLIDSIGDEQLGLEPNGIDAKSIPKRKTKDKNE
jgi:DNA-binding GntR family transcriptional regulator